MTSVAQYDLREPQFELLQAGFEPALVPYLEVPALVAACRLPERRKTLCGPLGTVAALVAQRVHGLSQAGTLHLLGQRCGETPYARSGAFSKALRKGPAGVVQPSAEQAGRLASRLARGQRGLRYLDGSGAHLLDTPANQARFPQSSTQAAGVGWPTMRYVALTDAASGAVLGLTVGNLKDHDAKLGRPLWDQLSAGEMVVADCGFSSYGFLWAMRKRRVEVVVRQHQRRRNQHPLPSEVGGVVDFDEVWRSPRDHADWWDQDLPARLPVRVVAERVSDETVVILNTNLPREGWSAREVLQLYLGRQRVETGFRELKVSLAADFLSVGAPEVAEAQVWGAVLTHNLLCCVMSEAAAEVGRTRWELSYQTCLDLVRLPSWAGCTAGPEEEAKRVRRELTRYPQPRRDPERREPRARKAPHRPHRLLKGQRAEELVRLRR